MLRFDTSDGSRFLIVPAAVLRALANSGSPASSSSRLIRSNDARGRKTSPRISTRSAGGGGAPAGVRSASGIARIVRTFEVTSSPRDPLPRVAPRSNRPSFVGERDAEPVDLQLGDIRDGDIRRRILRRCRRTRGRLVRRAQPSLHPLVERPQLVLVVRVVEAEHRHDVLDILEPFDGTAAHTLCRRVAGDELGMFRFDALELVKEPIELLVGDLGIVVDVVALLVMTDRVAQFTDTLQHVHREPAETTNTRSARRRTKKTHILRG